jgi:hypothetical protein
MTRRLVVAAVCVAALGGRALGAQTANWLTVGASATGIRLQNRFATGASSDGSGVALGVSGGAELGPVGLALGYWQGRVNADPGGTQQQDVIDGYALLVLRAQPWLGVKVGVEGGATSRLPAQSVAFWQAWLRAERTIVEPSVRGHVEVWRALDRGTQQDRGPLKEERWA